MRRFTWLWCLGLLAGLVGPIAPAAEGAQPRDQADSAAPIRALWITRWDYLTADDVRKAIENASWLGATDVMWQVRGQADAFYKSELEPWGHELLKDLPGASMAEKQAAGPGFDPLALAVSEAHARGMKIHAWINIMPLWKDTTPPEATNHPYNTHPEWRLYDKDGNAQPLNPHYVIVNPTHPGAQEHIVAVARDIMTRYDVDGLHMDYVRFVSDTMKDKGAYPGDAETLKRFTEATGVTDPTTEEGKAAFRGWIRDEITHLVRRIRAEAVTPKPGAVLTAAVWRRPELGRDDFMQDAARWLNEGAIDLAFPMIYTDDDERFRSDLEAWLAAAPPRLIVPGIGNYRQKPGQTARQAQMHTDTGGYAVFAYASLFESPNPEEDKSPEAQAARKARREALRTFMNPAAAAEQAAAPADPADPQASTPAEPAETPGP